MAAGSLTLALLMLATGATPQEANDVVPMNCRSFQIPIQIDPARRDNIKEVILYCSADQGKTWQQAGVASPDKREFVFYAPTDGLYWFTIGVADAKGNREPMDVINAKPRQKVLVDTLKPNLRIVGADRQGDEVVVNWEIQEDHPDLATLKLEYRTPDAPPLMWYKADFSPALKGQAKFRFLNSGPVLVRMQLMDEAGNVGMDEKVVPARTVASSPVQQTIVPVSGQANGSPNPPPAFPPVPGPSSAPAVSEPVAAVSTPAVTPPPAPPQVTSGLGAPSGMPGGVIERPAQVQPASLRQSDPVRQPERAWGAAATSSYNQTASRNAELSNRSMNNPGAWAGSQASAPGNHWATGQLLPLQFTNNRQISLDYEITKVGPSGLGSVELYITQDEGLTWQRFAENQSPDLRPPLTVTLPSDGVYGMRLVVGSRAGLGRRPPKPGDLPQMRVKVDTTPPEAKLEPPQADPGRRDALLLTWKALDENLSANPITLQWAETPNGEWHLIAADVSNSGRFSWILPKTPMPAHVYLRLIVRDLAGNVTYDDTPEPVSIDLLEPEGHLKGIVVASPRP